MRTAKSGKPTPPELIDARLSGTKTFFTGKPCPNGHISLRGTSSGSCLACGSTTWRPRLIYTMWKHAKVRSIEFNIPFSISRDDIKAAWPTDERCPIFGTPFRIADKTSRMDSPSLDRIKNEQGYIKGNIAVISLRANALKGSCEDPSIFRKIASYLEGKL